jgi:hypothetical protein
VSEPELKATTEAVALELVEFDPTAGAEALDELLTLLSVVFATGIRGWLEIASVMMHSLTKIKR